MVVEGEVLNNFPRFVGILIAEFATGGAVNLALKMKGDMIIETLDLKPTIDAMMGEFLDVVRVCFHSSMEKIEQGIGYKDSSHVEMDPAEGVKPIAKPRSRREKMEINETSFFPIFHRQV
ncbi:hypothetical protein Tco_0789746 [Tanacetum coccineum]